MIIYIEDILSILLGFFGALVTSLLLLSYKSNKHVNVYLIFILIFTTLKSFYIGLIPDHINALIYNKFNWLMPSLLLILPAFYLYFKSLIINEKKSFSNTIFHSLYPVFCTFVYLLQHVYILIPQEIWISIRKLNVVNYTFFYLGLTTLLLHNFYKNQKRDLKVEQHFNSVKTWILFLFITLILTSARALIEFYFDLEPSNGIFSVTSSVLKTVFISFSRSSNRYKKITWILTSLLVCGVLQLIFRLTTSNVNASFLYGILIPFSVLISNTILNTKKPGIVSSYIVASIFGYFVVTYVI